MDLDKKLGNPAPPDRSKWKQTKKRSVGDGSGQSMPSTLMVKGCFSTGFSTNIVFANLVHKLFLKLVLKANQVLRKTNFLQRVINLL